MALSHAILAVLSGEACSGYDLAKQFDGSVGFFWTASHQQIYRELSKLEQQGLIDLEVFHQDGKPDRKVYSITPAGLDWLRDWIMQPSPLPPVKDELLVKLFVGQLVPPLAIRQLLEDQRSQHAEILATYQAIEQNYFAHPQDLSPEMQFQYMTLRNGIHYETGWLAWCDEAMEMLGQ